MALLSISDLDRVQRVKAASVVMREQNHKYLATTSPSNFDVFLSHSYKDASLDKERLVNLKILLKEQFGLEVYIDWINDMELDRNAVTATTADLLRGRMRESRCLFFATTQSYSESKWMPWELGFMDGLKEKAAILPISVSGAKYTYTGQEYLGVYPYVDFHNNMLFVNFPDGKVITWGQWVK